MAEISAYTHIGERVASVRERVHNACLRCGRSPESVRIMLVSKTRTAEEIAAAIDAGARFFGESRIQEMAAKWAPRSGGDRPALSARSPGAETVKRSEIRLELVGHLQSNKVKTAVEYADAVCSIDKVSTVEALEKRLPVVGAGAEDFESRDGATMDRVSMDILLEINTSGEESKFGVSDDEAEVYGLVEALLARSSLRLRGLMTIAPFVEDEPAIRACFSRLRAWYEQIEARYALPAWDTLSMGMSGDLEPAIEEGSTVVRPGTAVFGPRKGTA